MGYKPLHYRSILLDTNICYSVSISTLNHNLYSLWLFPYKFYSSHRMNNKSEQPHKIHFGMDNLKIQVEMTGLLCMLHSLCLILLDMMHMSNDKVDKLDWWGYQNNQQCTYIHQKPMFWIVLEKNNNLCIRNKMSKWDKYFCKVYKLNWYHHHNILSCKDKIYQVEEFFEKIKDKRYIEEDRDLYIHHIDRDILCRWLCYCRSNRSRMDSLRYWGFWKSKWGKKCRQWKSFSKFYSNNGKADRHREYQNKCHLYNDMCFPPEFDPSNTKCSYWGSLNNSGK